MSNTAAATARPVTTVTAAAVRAWVLVEPKRMEALSAEARVSVLGRGLLSPEVVKMHNTRRRTRVYFVGASKAATAAHQSDRAALREAGLLGDNARGPLSKAARAFLAERSQG